VARLTLGNLELFQPPKIVYEFTGARNSYSSSSSCVGRTLDSTELTYDLFLSHNCTLAEAQDIQAQIEAELKLAPNLTLTRQETPDAHTYVNRVKEGDLAVPSDKTLIRARYTHNRTLAFTLTLTILPEGAQGSGAIAFPVLKVLAAQGDFDWVGDDIRMLLFTESSSAPLELAAGTLDAFVDLSEASGAGYVRVSVSGRAVDTGAGTFLELLCDDPVFAPQADSPEEITGGIIYQHNGADTVNYPLFLIQSFAPTNPGGTAMTIPVNLSGLF
jgi:hypothetical protein